MHVRNIGNRRSDQDAFDFIEAGLVIAPGVEQVALSIHVRGSHLQPAEAVGVIRRKLVALVDGILDPSGRLERASRVYWAVLPQGCAPL